MSDYIFMLESHLSPEQNRVVAEVQAAAAEANVNVFLTGGAMRDMLGGYRIRDLDFSIEGNALKVAKTVARKSGARTVSLDENRRSVELLFPGGVTAQIAMSRQERYGKTGARPQVSTATIQEDLRGRDFSVNAIALSLNRASRGLLLDPMNGLADLEHRELRTLGMYTFYDDPSRMLRLVRFRARLGFQVEDRTRQQLQNAREAEVQKYIPRRAVLAELKSMATEDKPGEIMRTLADEGLAGVISPALAGTKLNLAGFAKLEKVLHLLPDNGGSRQERIGPFFYVLMEKLTPRERQALVKGLELKKSEVDGWKKLEARAKKLESALKSPRLRKPSQVYFVLAKAPTDEVILLLYRSALRPVQERLRNHFQKYVPLAQELGPEQVAAIPAKPGTPKYQKAYETMLATHLDRRPKKPLPPPEEPPPAVEAVMARGRGR